MHYMTVLVTERGGHAAELVQDMALEFDAILAVSGDGLLHEILNGLAKRPDARKALRTPVAPIPTGSGNGFSVSLLGLKVCHITHLHLISINFRD